MEILAMEGIRAIGALGGRRRASDVAPALAAEGAQQVEEDLFEGSTKGQDRGIDEDETARDEDQDSKDDGKQVNLFA